jgi:membrane-bound acyltransferase YfiQ involved in biofilm formation
LSTSAPVYSASNTTLFQIDTPSLLKRPVTNHLFADNVRFFSMAAVIFLHTFSAFGSLSGISGSDSFMLGVQQAVKFGTIGFFLISGFLMAESLDRRPPLEYLKRRLRVVFAPWLLWFSAFLVLSLTGDVVHGRLRFGSFTSAAHFILNRLHGCLFDSAYWFVPNLIVALCVLLLCRRFLYDVRLGFALLAVSLIYGLDIHTQWFALPSHTEALFGFVFYLWLGAWAARNFRTIEAWVSHIPMWNFVASIAMAGLIAIKEAELLLAAGAPSPLSTLRISNQLYSVLVVLAIFKVRKVAWPKGLNVRASTFGLYLSHTIVLSLLLRVATRTFLMNLADEPWANTRAIALCLGLGGFVITYGCSFALTHWLLERPSLGWVLGRLATSRTRGFSGATGPLCGPEPPEAIRLCKKAGPGLLISNRNTPSSRAEQASLPPLQ